MRWNSFSCLIILVESSRITPNGSGSHGWFSWFRFTEGFSFSVWYDVSSGLFLDQYHCVEVGSSVPNFFLLYTIYSVKGVMFP